MGKLREGKFRVVVGVDFSEASRHAVVEAIELAHVMRAVDMQFVYVVPAARELHDANVLASLSDQMPDAMVRLERFVRDELFVRGQGVRCELAFHVRLGEPAREIHQIAVDVDADMIIVGASPEARGMKRWFHRSTAATLVRDAHVPVVVARPKDFEGLTKSDTPDAPRAGADLSRSALSSYTYVELAERPRDSHIAGLI